ncbi:MAG: hypothetical protein OEL79_02370 [Chromatiales bacterium]|nr:hypothetical protein [Chromatiales bacterium]
MMRENGKVRITAKEGVPCVEIYHHGEIQLYDVVWINQNLRWFNQQLNSDVDLPLYLPASIIIEIAEESALSENACLYMKEMMSDCSQLAFVLHQHHQDVIENLIENSRLLGRNVKGFTTALEAMGWIKSYDAPYPVAAVG